MQHPDEGMIHAWLDGQLSPEEGAGLEAHARECTSCAAAIAEARGLVAASSRIVSALDIVPGGVIPAAAPVHRTRRPWYASTQLRAAAALLFVGTASMLVLRGQKSIAVDATSSRPVIADTQAEATQPAEAADESRSLQAPGISSHDAAAKASPGAVTTGRRNAGKIVAEGDQAAVRSRRAPAAALQKAEPPAAARLEAASDAARQELTLIRMDTAGRVDVRVYRVEDGIEVTLTEIRTMEADFSGKGVTGVTGVAATGKQREARNQAQAAEAGAPVAPPPPAPVRADSASPLPISSIRWVDPVTRRTYTLSGRLSTQRLEQLRKEIEAKSR